MCMMLRALVDIDLVDFLITIRIQFVQGFINFLLPIMYCYRCCRQARRLLSWTVQVLLRHHRLYLLGILEKRNTFYRYNLC